jgi:hypothetical protein
VSFDVVVVPDFAGGATQTFEARTLLFLASWMENAGVARGFPVHVACIGPPPPRIRNMAALCGASLSVHEPLCANRGRTANKLRGLEVEGRERFVALLDTDIVVLGDPSKLDHLGYGVAVSPARGRGVPEAYWDRIYGARGLEPPVDARGGRQHPYHNAGVVYLPWDCGLRGTWETEILAIAALFDDGDPAARDTQRGDQVALAVSLERLRRRGVPTLPLPDGFNVGLRQLSRRLVAPDEVKLFHATGLFRRIREPLSLSNQLRLYRVARIRRILGWVWGSRDRPTLRDLPRFLRDTYRVGRRMQAIWQHRVEPIIGRTESRR